jgi:hypothetical protein
VDQAHVRFWSDGLTEERSAPQEVSERSRERSRPAQVGGLVTKASDLRGAELGRPRAHTARIPDSTSSMLKPAGADHRLARCPAKSGANPALSRNCDASHGR